MSGEIRHVLVIPSDEHREALLGTRHPWWRPPIVWSAGDGDWVAHPAPHRWRKAPHALALVWLGQSTGPDAVARALAVLAPVWGMSDAWIVHLATERLSLANALKVGRDLEDAGIGRLEVIRGPHTAS